MIETLAKFFRGINSRLVGEKRYVVEKLLKAFYATSMLFHRQGTGKQKGFIVINNFDSNLKLKINTSWTMGFSIFWTGFHELKEFLFLNNFLKPDMVFVDVGANMGEYTLFAAKRLTRGKVLAFEPFPKILTLLNENIRLNNFSSIQVLPYGLSNKEGILPIHELDEMNGNEGLSTFYPGSQKIKIALNVPLKSFDEEFDSYQIDRIDFMKFDIEGGELPALRGAKKSIEKFRPWVMVEINEASFRAAGYQPQDVYDFFNALSYLSYEVLKGGKLKPASPLAGFKNIVFKPS